MKTLYAIAFALILAGCTTPQQTVTYNTMSGLEQSVTAAVDAYDALVIKGAIPTNDVPKVTRAYNLFQASFVIALDAARYNTNAVAPPNLAVEAGDVINLINTITKKGSK